MPIAEALAIIDKDTGTAFDADCVAALKRGLARLTGPEEAPGPSIARPTGTG
jgi:HD-GYP domain-containing protein (c-di-GMP phosphodiesterase class II)